MASRPITTVTFAIGLENQGRKSAEEIRMKNEIDHEQSGNKCRSTRVVVNYSIDGAWSNICLFFTSLTKVGINNVVAGMLPTYL
jgi:hypothetical protein